MLRRLVIAGLAAVLMASCTSNDEPSSTPSTFPVFDTTTTTALSTAPIAAKALSPEKSSVQGNGGRGMVVVLSFTARDASVLPAEFRSALTSAPATARPGRNPAFPGLVVGLSTTGTAFGGPTSNLANLFQVVTPASQLDGSMQVTAVWTNGQADFGSDVDATLVAFVVSGNAPDVIPETQANIDVISNPIEVTFRVSGGAGAAPTAAAGTPTSTTVAGATTTTVRGTTTTARPVTTVAPATTTARPATTTTVPATTATTKCLLPGVLC
ncbi:MAG: hypothetical protein ACR2KK_24100 [Acidimicrobiales bacterium]